MKFILRTFKKLCHFFFIILILISALFIIVNFSTQPTNDRTWNEDQKILSYGEISSNLVSLHNIRNFTYASTTSYISNYYDKTFDLNKIKKVWYIVEPFSGIPGSAHTFLSFEFEDNQFVSVSVEIRKEQGETYSPIKGLFNKYELMYVFADEKDAVKLRSNYRKDLVYVYPVRTTVEKARTLFTDMVERANTLKDYPEFYNTVTNTCTTNIVRHVNEITPDRVPFFNLRVLLPENSDKLAYELGLLDTNLPFEEARKRFFINDRAMKYADDEDFSVRIREEN
ncbi:MAG: DUF4105 domain-containing protein [bacterium]|nr:DUF4105 domain-containing protein [bacterium]